MVERAQVKIVLENGNTISEDRFISKKNEHEFISIQLAVREFLATHKSSAMVNGICLSKKKPLDSHELLCYRAEKNGLEPTKHASLIHDSSFKASGVYCAWWAKGVALSEDKMNALTKKRDEQRENRRHNGDSPCAT